MAMTLPPQSVPRCDGSIVCVDGSLLSGSAIDHHHLDDDDPPANCVRHRSSSSSSSSPPPKTSTWRPLTWVSSLFATSTMIPPGPKLIGVQHRLILLVLLLHLPLECNSVRLVALNVPARVQKGSDLELSCLFDLGNATLYALKWFYRAHEWDRDEQEFFRFTPRFKPEKQVFPLEGVQVELEKSGGGTVYIRNTNEKTAGKYKCEVSVEGTFHTVAAEKMMMVFNAVDAPRPVPMLMMLATLVLLLSLANLVP